MAELVGEMNIDYLDVYDAWGGLIKKEDVPEGTGLCVSLPIEEKIPSPCFELYRRVHVMADGKVGACVCVDLEGEIQIGDISKQTLEEIWHGDKLATYRSDWVNGKLPKVCQTCTRYQGIDDFIAENPKRVLIDYMRRAAPGSSEVDNALAYAVTHRSPVISGIFQRTNIFSGVRSSMCGFVALFEHDRPIRLTVA